jgi:heme/copper-type cytochrome/quinol oxidase subunit 2
MTIRSSLFWVAAACCILAELAILRSAFFGRAATFQQTPGQTRATPRPNRTAEIVWAVIPAVGLLLVLYLTWRAVDAPRPPAADVTHGGASIGA